MKSKLLPLLYGLCCLTLAQTVAAQASQNNESFKMQKQKIGLKVGTSYSFMPDLKSYSVTNNFGFFIGGYFAPPSTSRLGFRSEVIFSRQGYDYSTNQQTGNVMLSYLMLPQLATLKITRFLELQAGTQLALVLNAKVDSSASPSSVPSLEKATDYFNRANYGLAAGFEVFPSSGSFIGARYNLFFDMWKGSESGSYPAYVPAHSGNLKNGLVQVYVGFRF